MVAENGATSSFIRENHWTFSAFNTGLRHLSTERNIESDTDDPGWGKGKHDRFGNILHFTIKSTHFIYEGNEIYHENVSFFHKIYQFHV